MDSIQIASSKLLNRHQACELPSRFSIHVEPLGLTPLGECVRVNVDTDRPLTVKFYRLASLLGCGKPLIVSQVEFIAIREKGLQSHPLLTPVPGEANDFDLSHFLSSACDIQRDGMEVGMFLSAT